MGEVMNIEKSSVEILDNSNAVCNGCKLYYIHVKVNNIKQKAQEVMVNILDKSWLKELDNEIDYNSFLVRSEETINILTEILKEIGNEIGAEFGEFLVSSVAQSTLEETSQHTKFPLAEIWKEKVKGNPGFDFHTISNEDILFYGEAKFNMEDNAYPKAISQICKFINKKKDIMELTDLKKLNSRINEKHLSKNARGYVAAFSIHNNFKNIFQTIQNNKNVKQYLQKYPELFFIGIEV